MTSHLIELSDPGLRISHSSDVLDSSPGFVSVAGKAPVFGREARKQCRLHPRQTFNQFWGQLSLDPLVYENDFFRHQADAAYGHLKRLGEEHQINEQVIFAVPSHYSRNQLGVLLGLARQCPFETHGLVDLGLLAAATTQINDRALYLDMQLHQTVLTLISHEDGQLQRQRSLQIPGTGLLALQEAWSAMLTDAFVRQARFNPLHNAETEQYLFNLMDTWIDSAMRDSEVLMEINYKGAVHQASTNRGYFEQKVRSLLQQVRSEIDALGGTDCQLILPTSAASLPGVSLYLPAFDVISPDQISENAFRFMDTIRRDPEHLSFVTRLPAHTAPKASPTSHGPAWRLAVLEGHRAYPLPSTGHFFISGHGQSTEGPGLTLDCPLDSPLEITLHAEGARLQACPADVRLNASPVTPGQRLQPGDQLQAGKEGPLLHFIEVC